MGARLVELVVDARDPDRVADFWSAVLGWGRTGRYEGVVEIADPGGSLPTVVFTAVPQPQAAKNRLHIDVAPAGCPQEEELERLLGLGAVKVDVGQGRNRTWVVLADSEGNEFCLLREEVG